MYKLDTVDTLLLIREVAVKHSAMTPLSGERELKQSHLDYLERLLRDGLFTSPVWVVVRDKKTGKLYRVDGQHSSTLLARCSAELFPGGLEVVVLTYVSDDIEHDAPALFEMVNNPRSVRSNTDKMTFFRARYKEVRSIPSDFLMRSANGYHHFLKISATKNGHKRKALSNARDYGEYLADASFRSFTMWLYKWELQYAEGQKVPNRWMLSKPGIVSVIFEGWKTDPKIATDFWGHVILDDHPQRDDISRELGRILNTWRRGSVKKAQSLYHRQASGAWLAEFRKRAGGI